eukprot:2416407-Pleurochrysis_carterae.AAC.3
MKCACALRALAHAHPSAVTEAALGLSTRVVTLATAGCGKALSDGYARGWWRRARLARTRRRRHVETILQAIQFMHDKGVVHRDLKARGFCSGSPHLASAPAHARRIRGAADTRPDECADISASAFHTRAPVCTPGTFDFERAAVASREGVGRTPESSRRRHFSVARAAREHLAERQDRARAHPHRRLRVRAPHPLLPPPPAHLPGERPHALA